MSLDIAIRRVENVAVIDLSGRITLGEASGRLRDAIKDLVANDSKDILLNLAEVSYMDSSGLGELVGAFATVSNRGGKLKLLGLQPRVFELMHITKLYSVFEIFPDEEPAIRSFRSSESARQG